MRISSVDIKRIKENYVRSLGIDPYARQEIELVGRGKQPSWLKLRLGKPFYGAGSGLRRDSPSRYKKTFDFIRPWG